MAAGGGIDPIHQFEIKPIIGLRPFGLDLSFTNASLLMVAIVAVISAIMIYGSSQRSVVPGRLQSLAEMIYEFVASTVTGVMGKEGMTFFPLVFSLFMFVLSANMLGMIPGSFTATSHIIVTAAFAFLVIGTVLVYGIVKHGSHFFGLFVPSGVPGWLLPFMVLIEAVSFVHPKYVPQMAGAETVMAALPHEAGRSRIGLVLNGRGYDRALTTAVDEVNVSLSATDGFGLKNQGLAVKDQLSMLGEIVARRHNSQTSDAVPSLSATLSCVWGCPFDGEVSVQQVGDLVGAIGALGVGEIALADTIGAGDPWAVTRKVEAARRAAPDARLRLHFHDTRNTGLANAYAGVEAGVEVLDASVGGIGGCPFAPGATGNIATEDLVYMLERAGFQTGYDLAALIETARWIGAALGRPAPSALSRAGGFPRR